MSIVTNTNLTMINKRKGKKFNGNYNNSNNNSNKK